MTMSSLFSFYNVESWVLIGIMCETKRLNPLFRLQEASEVLSFSPGPSLFSMGKIRAYKRYIVPGPGRHWGPGGKSTHAKFFCNQAQND